MAGSIRVGSLFGIPIRIHVTFLLVLPFLAVAFGRVYTEAARTAGVPPEQLRGSPFLWGLGVALALFVSVLVHELAHSLYATRRGGRVRDITLLMIGGVSQISELPGSGRREAMMAAVGPLTSLALGGAFYLAYRASAATGLFDLEFALFHLCYLNVALGFFNLLPAFPMDGGRVLRGVLAGRWGLLRATRAAAAAGKAFAVLFAIVGFLTINLVLLLVAFFVYVGAEAESRGVLVKALLGHVRVRDLMGPRRAAVDAEVSVYDVAERMLQERRTAFPVAVGGKISGVVVLEDVQRIPAAERHARRVADAARTCEPLSVDDDAPVALRRFAEARTPLVPVVDGGALVGVLTHAELMRGLQLTELESTQHPPAEPRTGRASGYSRAEQHA